MMIFSYDDDECNKKSQINLVSDPLIAATNNLQPNFPGGANVTAHLTPDSLDSPHSSPPWTAAQSVHPFLQDWCRILPIRYVAPPHFPQNFPFHGRSGPPSDTYRYRYRYRYL